MRLTKEELSRLYHEQTRRAASNREGCLSNQMIVRASAGEMTEPERGRVVEHLSKCSDCAAEYRLIRSLRSGPPQAAPASAKEESQRNLRVVGSAETTRRRSPFMLGLAPLVLASAASLLIVSLALSTWVLSLRLQNQRLIAEIDARNQAIRDARDQLSESATQISQLRRDVDAFSQPQLNAPVIDLDRADSVRGAPTRTSRTVLIPDRANVLTLILNIAGQPSFPGYSLEILGPGGVSVWSGRGLLKSAFDTFTVAIPRRLLTSGQYEFMLYGLQDDRRQLLEDYRVRFQDQ